MNRDTYTHGDPNNRNYMDATGQPLRPRDAIVYVTRAGSSVYMNFAIIDQIVDTDRPAYIGYKDGTRIESWDRAFKLKVKKLEQADPLEPDTFRLSPLSPRWDSGTGRYEEVDYDDAKTTTISVIERVVKVDIHARL